LEFLVGTEASTPRPSKIAARDISIFGPGVDHASHHPDRDLRDSELVPEFQQHWNTVGRTDLVGDGEIKNGLGVFFERRLKGWNHGFEGDRFSIQEHSAASIEREGACGRRRGIGDHHAGFEWLEFERDEFDSIHQDHRVDEKCEQQEHHIDQRREFDSEGRLAATEFDPADGNIRTD
jgi:hypothetical protein